MKKIAIATVIAVLAIAPAATAKRHIDKIPGIGPAVTCDDCYRSSSGVMFKAIPGIGPVLSNYRGVCVRHRHGIESIPLVGPTITYHQCYPPSA